MSTKSSFTAEEILQNDNSFKELSPRARLAVIGDPIEHSLSPKFHNAALKEIGEDCQYIRIHVPKDKLEAVLRRLSELHFIGANITIPHKVSVLELVDEADEHAKRAGGVNTVLFEDSKLYGFSTDGPGLVRAVREEFYIDVRGLRVMILGAGGGVGRAIAAQCVEERCDRLVLVNRTVEKAQIVANLLKPFFSDDRLEGPADRLVVSPWEETALRQHLEYVDLIINASSIGMKRSDLPAISPSLLNPALMIYDTVYLKGRKTRLIEEALSEGARAANGLSMLLHQGALSFEIWFNREAPIDTMRTALLA